MTTMTKPNSNGHAAKPSGVRTYRARKLEELIPQIRTELGPDAIILRQREGLMGGIGGFFTQRCVEVEAQAARKLDIYDDDQDAMPDGPAPSPAPEPFAAALAQAAAGFAEPEVPAPQDEPVVPEPPLAAGPPAKAEDPGAAALVRELVDRGVSKAWAQELVMEAESHRSVFARTRRDAVRAALAASIRTASPLPADGARVAFIGADLSGKTRLTAALAAAYRRASALTVRVIALGPADSGTEIEDLLRGRRELKELLGGHDVPVAAAAPGQGATRALEHADEDEMVIVDAGPLSPDDRAEVRARSAELKRLELDAVYVAVPATLRADAARKLIQRLKPLKPAGIAVTHADRTDQLGVAVELAHVTGLPIAYLHEGLEVSRALSQPDSSALASRLLP
jgi:hypothetical protein